MRSRRRADALAALPALGPGLVGGLASSAEIAERADGSGSFSDPRGPSRRHSGGGHGREPSAVELEALREISSELGAGGDAGALCRLALDRVANRLGANSGAVFLQRGDASLCRAACVETSRADRPPADGLEGYARRVLMAGGPVIVAALPGGCGDQIDASVSRHVLALPLQRKERVEGALVLTRRANEAPFTEAEVSFGAIVCFQLALALDGARGRVELERHMCESELRQRQLEAYARDLGLTYLAEKERSRQLAQALAELERTSLGTARALAIAVEAKDEYTAGHLARVTRYGLALLRILAPASESDRQYEYGFLLHDLGKLAVPDAVLSKRGPLSHDEWLLVREHPTTGRRMLEGIPFLARASDIVYSHHERWDGKGYPRGLTGEEIPFGARLFAIADAFDAMTSSRPYRPARSIDDSLAELVKAAGTQFWPEAVEAFVVLPRDELAAIACGDKA